MIDIKNTFLKLTSKRYPYGKEDEVIELIPEYNLKKDSVGNYYIVIKRLMVDFQIPCLHVISIP